MLVVVSESQLLTFVLSGVEMVKPYMLAAICPITYIEPMIQRTHETCKAIFRENLSAMKELASDPIIHYQFPLACNEPLRLGNAKF